MSEQQINPDNSLDTTELDQVTGGIVVHDRSATSTTADARRNQEQGDKLRAMEERNKSM